MTTSTESYIKHVLDGGLVAISCIVLAVVILVTLLILRVVAIKIGGKIVSNKDVIISTGHLNGFNLEPFKDDYDAHQLVEVLEALIAGVPESEFIGKSMDTLTIRELAKRYSKSPRRTVVEEEEADEDEYYSLDQLPALGIDPNYIPVELAGIEYEIKGSIAYVQTFDGSIPYQILKIEEGTLLYRVGAPSLLIEGK